MGRPRGSCGAIRRALRDAAERILEPATWRDLAAVAQIGWKAAVTAVKNMVRSGELVPVDSVRVAGSRRPMTRYALAQDNEIRAKQDHTDSVVAGLTLWLQR